jgi:hypothetical protein
MIFHGSIHPLLRGGTGTALPYLGWLLKPKPRKDNAVSMDEIIIHKGYDAERSSSPALNRAEYVLAT